MYVTTWPISKRGNKWEMLSYETRTDGRTAVCHNKPVFWRAYKNEWPISWNYEYIIFGQVILQNFHQFKAFVGLSDCRTIDRRTIGLSVYSYGPSHALLELYLLQGLYVPCPVRTLFITGAICPMPMWIFIYHRGYMSHALLELYLLQGLYVPWTHSPIFDIINFYFH
jgi:hypothetical protein